MVPKFLCSEYECTEFSFSNMPWPSLNTSSVSSSFGPTASLADFLVLVLLKSLYNFNVFREMFFFSSPVLLACIMVWPVLCWDWAFFFPVLDTISRFWRVCPFFVFLFFAKRIRQFVECQVKFFIWINTLIYVLIWKVAFIYSLGVFKVLLLLRQWGERRWLQIPSEQKCLFDLCSSLFGFHQFFFLGDNK